MEITQINHISIIKGKDENGHFLAVRSTANDQFTRVSPVYRLDREYSTADEVFKESMLLKDRLEMAFNTGYNLSGGRLTHQDGRFLTIELLLQPYYEDKNYPEVSFEDMLRTGVMEPDA